MVEGEVGNNNWGKVAMDPKSCAKEFGPYSIDSSVEPLKNEEPFKNYILV